MPLVSLPVSDNVKNILVVGKNNQIGDMICSLPLYAALKKKYPRSTITLVAAKTNYPVPIKELNPYIHKVIVFDKSKVSSLIKFIKELRKVNYQIGIVPSTFAYSTTSHLINYFSGAKIRVGVNSIEGVKNKAAKYLNVKKDFFWESEKKHQRLRNIDVVKQIGCTLSTDELNKIGFNLNEEELLFAENFLNDNFIDKSKPVFGFHPGAGKKANLWNTDNFVSLISELYKKYNNNVLITAGWTDKEVVSSISSKLNDLKINFTLAENFEIKKLAAVLSKINLYITNDTGPMHIAGSVGTKMISLFGPTKSYEWAPVGEKQFYIKSETGNINDIGVNDVLSLCNKILNSS